MQNVMNPKGTYLMSFIHDILNSTKNNSNPTCKEKSLHNLKFSGKYLHISCLILYQLLISCLIHGWVCDLTVPMHLGLNWHAPCAPYQLMAPCYFSKVPDGPQPYTLYILWLQETGTQIHCLSEAKASHSQRMWAEVLCSAPHLLHNGLSDSPIR
jgi:hypothetical protein